MTEMHGPPHWSEAEQWAWDEIRLGRVADFSARLGKLDTRRKAGWGKDRLLRPGFLRAILFDAEYAEYLPVEGVRIDGALFDQPVNLGNGRSHRSLWLNSCRFEGLVDLTGLEVEGWLSLSKSSFRASPVSLIFMAGKASHADFSEASFSGRVDLLNCRIEGQLALLDVRLRRHLELGGVRAYQLFLRDASCGGVNLSSAVVGDVLDLGGCVFHGQLLADGVRVGGDLVTASGRKGARFKGPVHFQGAVVSATMDLIGARFEDDLVLRDLRVSRNLLMRSSPSRTTFFDGNVDISEGRIAGQIDLSGSVVKGSLTMSGLHAGENLILSVRVAEGAVNLMGAVVSATIALSGGTFKDDVFLNDVRVSRHLIMRSSPSGPTVFNGNVDISSGRIAGQIDMNGSAVEGQLTMNGLTVGENLLLSTRVGKEFSAAAATIQGHLEMTGAEVKGVATFENSEVCKSFNLSGSVFHEKAVMTNLQVGQHLSVKAVFEKGLSLAGAQIGDRFFVDGSELRGVVEMNRLKVAGDFVFRSPLDKRQLGDGSMDLSLADIGGVFILGFAADGPINMTAIHVGQLAFLIGAFNFPVDMPQAQVGHNLDLSGAIFAGLDLSGAIIGGLLRLGISEERKAVWAEAAKLDLRDATAGALQDWAKRDPEGNGWQSSWPAGGCVELDGFSYGRLGGAGVVGSQQMLDRSIDWYVDWLSRDEPYSPQPYEHLAATFRRAGEPGKADLILYESRERARRTAKRNGAQSRWVGLALLKWTIGYGIGLRFFIALLWVILLVAAGFVVLSLDGSSSQEWPERIVYSLDELLPIVELRGNAGLVPMDAFAERYFYVHRLLGFFLGAFIAAGVAGLTQYSKRQ